MPNETLYKMAISNFHNYWFLTPKNQNFHFSKINTHKIKIFDDIKKPEYTVQNYIPTISVQNFKLFFIPGCAMTPKPGKDDVTFLNRPFWHF